MKSILKLAFGVAVLGFVGLVGLSVMSIVAALVLGRSVSHKSFPVNQEAAESLAWAGPGQDSPASHWSQPAQVQVIRYADQPTTFLLISKLLLVFLVVLAFGALLFLLVRIARIRKVNPSGDSELVHELARRAQEMSQRMEALETILLDRTRNPFYNEKAKQQ